MSSIGSVSKPSTSSPHISFSEGLIGPRTRARPRALAHVSTAPSSAGATSPSAASKNPNIATLSPCVSLMQPVVDRRDASHDAIAAPREEQFDVRMREKRIASSG